MIRSCVAALLNYDHPQSGQASALRALHQEFASVEYIQPDRNWANTRLLDQARRVQPDWMWLQLQDTEVIQASTLHAIREAVPHVTLVHWTGDARPSVSDYLSSICRATDLTLSSCRGHLDMFRAAGAPRAEYLQIGLDWFEDVLALPPWEPPFRVPDVVFCGNHYKNVFPGTRDREDLIRALKRAGIDVGVVARPGGWPRDIPVVGQCAVKQQVHVYERAKVALSVSHFKDIDGYFSDRQLIAMASGTPVVSQWVPGIDIDFVNGEHCFVYHEVDAAVEQVRLLLSDEAMRERMGVAGRVRVMQRHSWYQRMCDVVGMVEAIKGGIA